jgi:hypothetical protein
MKTLKENKSRKGKFRRINNEIDTPLILLDFSWGFIRHFHSCIALFSAEFSTDGILEEIE